MRWGSTIARSASSARTPPALKRTENVNARGSVLNGAPEEIRTPDPQIRSLVLYPAELRARFSLGILGFKGPVAFRTRSGKVAKERLSYPLRPRLASAGSAFGGAILGSNPGDFGIARPRGLGDWAIGPYARARSLRMLSSSTGRSGIAIRKVAPIVPSTRWMLPPWARTNSAAIASPSPLPPGRPEVWNASNR